MTSPELPQIIGEAPEFLEMLEHVSRAAPLSKPVLVIGERGTGKELIASRLHFLSTRWDRPLVKLNCAALTESILESELFGHEAGAFTGADRKHIGRFERADSGTLILDELGTIPLRMQEKILRVIEYGEFERVGGTETVSVDVRIVGSTNEDLPGRAVSGEFRADLLDRLAFDVVNVPPLRRRPEDILPLAYAFAVNMTSELHREYFPGFSSAAASALLRHAWPGNVRELKNAVERSVYRSDDPDSRIEQIVFDPFAGGYQPIRAAALPPTPQEAKAPDDFAHNDPGLPELPVSLKDAVASLEIDLVEVALEAGRYNQRTAAGLLELSYDQFRGLVRKYDIETSGARIAPAGNE
jgi:psp operon transcriptional activator